MGLRSLLSHWRLRRRLLDELVRVSLRKGREDLLEAGFVFRSNLKFHSLWEEEVGRGNPRPERVEEGWRRWLRENLL
jgi:hypothetical protein